MLKQSAPDAISPTSVGLLLCVPDNLVPMFRQALWAYQFNYAYKRGVGDVESTKRAFVDILGQIEMACCDKIADCIEDSDAVQNAIENYLNNSSQVIKNINSDITKIQNFTLQSSEIIAPCDDKRWSGILFLVERLNTNQIDFLEIITDDIADVFDRVNNAISAIPVIGKMINISGIDGWLDLVSNLAQDFLDEYQSSDTIAKREGLACDIFCMTEGCNITIDDMILAVQEKLPQNIIELIGNTVFDALSFLLLGTLTSDNFYYAMYLIQLYIIKIDEDYIGLNAGSFAVNYARGTNTPSDDHIVLCACPGDYLRLDGNGNAGIVLVDIGYGVATYDSINDLYTGLQTIPVNTYRSAGLEIQEPIYSLSVQIDVNQTRAGGFIQIVKNATQIELYSLPLGITQASYEATVNATAGDKIFINLIIGALSNADGSIAQIIRIEGQYL